MNSNTNTPRCQLSHLLRVDSKPQPFKKIIAQNERYLHAIVTPATFCPTNWHYNWLSSSLAKSQTPRYSIQERQQAC